MSRNPLQIKEGAYIVSDAHYSHLRPELLTLIRQIHTKQLRPTQLIFMGDIFDALFGSINFTCQQNSEMIKLVNEIAQEIEVIYLEGNHDFKLQGIFSNVRVHSIKEQPVEAYYQGKKIYLAHGDFDGDLLYRLYTSFIRNSVVLFILKYIDIVSNHAILKNLDRYLSKKNDCKAFDGFEEFITERLANKYVCDYFIEGHFHQNRAFKIADIHYINLAAFACNQRYFIVKFSKDKELLEEKTLQGDIKNG